MAEKKGCGGREITKDEIKRMIMEGGYSLEKSPEVYFPSRLKIGRRYSLVVRFLPEEMAENVKETLLELASEQEIKAEIEQTVRVEADDFEIENPTQKTLIPLTEASEPIVFYLTPNSLGDKRIRLKCYQNESYAGEISLYTTVVEI